MANEIWHSYQDGSTLYALIWRQTDDKIYDAVAGSDTFDTYADADIGDYDVPLTAAGTTGDYYSVDFPAGISAGIYRVTVMLQAGASPHVDNDIPVAQGEIYWDGTAEQNFYTLIGADGDTLETLSDQLDVVTANTGKVVNVYPTGEKRVISGGSTLGVEDEKL